MSRCETVNSFIKAFLKSTNSILELVHNLDRVIKDYRNNEVTTQFYCTYYTLVLTTVLDAIELSAPKLYTRVVSREVKKQIKDCKGQYIVDLGNDSREKATLFQYSALYSALSYVVTLGCEENEDFSLARDAISNLVEILQHCCVKKDGRNVLLNQCRVRDPTMTATKSAPKWENASVCASEEEPKPKRRCCTKCGVAWHTRRACCYNLSSTPHHHFVVLPPFFLKPLPSTTPPPASLPSTTAPPPLAPGRNHLAPSLALQNQIRRVANPKPSPTPLVMVSNPSRMKNNHPHLHEK
ncbi:hypothetical protein AHAS_Ahas05G0255100 [Arachis hypogaea]